MTGFLNDLRHALRGLVKRPAFSSVAVLTLALGIGATTAVFTFVDGVLIRPLPFADSQDLISIQHQGREGRDELPISAGLYLLYKEQASSLGEIAMYVPAAVNLLVGDEPERAAIQVVTPSFFDVLRVSPAAGRGFLPEEELPGAEPVVVISHGLWQESFGGEPSVLGRTVVLNGASRRIVGVMPDDFGFPDRRARAWIPFEVDPVQAPLAAFGAVGIARLGPGNSPESAHVELQGLINRLSELFPDSDAPAFLEEVGLRASIQPLKESIVGDVSTTLWILLGTVGFVLLIACANVANLLLVRAETRQRELALRLAMGASRREIVRFFMGESLLLAVTGGALGVAVSSWALSLSTSFLPANLPRIAEVGLDFRVLGFTALVTLGCAVFFGLFPLARYSVDDLTTQLKDGGGRGATGGKDRHRLRNGLVVIQVALALVLLVGAGLMFRSVQALRGQDPGFAVEGVLSARLSLPSAESPGWQETAGFFRQLRERMIGQPGVSSVGLAQPAPLAGGVAFVTTGVEDHPRGPGEMPVFSSQMSVGEGYFETMGIEVLTGRTFQPGDGAEGTRAVLISESFANHWWPDTSPLGRRIGDGGPDGTDWWEIVGVVADVTHQNLQADPEELIYFPITRGPAASPGAVRSMDILIKTSGDPLQLIPILRRELRDLNPRVPAFESKDHGRGIPARHCPHGRYHDHAGGRLRHRPPSWTHRDLWSDFLRGVPTNPGDRRSDGVGRDRTGGSRNGGPSGFGSGGRRSGSRTCGGRLLEFPDVFPALSRGIAGHPHLRIGVGDVGGCGHVRQLASGPPGRRRGSEHRFEGGLMGVSPAPPSAAPGVRGARRFGEPSSGRLEFPTPLR